MKICMIFPAYPPSYQRDGIGDYTRILVDRLRSEGHDVWVIASGRYAGDDRKVIRIGAGKWGIKELAAIIGAARDEGFDIINMQYTPVSYGRGVFFKLLPFFSRFLIPETRFVTTFHTLVGPGWQARLNAIMLSVFSHAAIGTNEEISFLFKKWLWILAHKYAQVPIGANIPPSTKDPLTARKELIGKYGMREDAVILSNFGFTNPGKGIEDIISAMSRLDGRDRYKLLLVGAEREEDAAYRRAVKDWIRAEKVEDNVVWVDETDDAKASDILRGSDIYVAPYSDGISIRRGSLMAAMVNAVPVISTFSRIETPYFKDGENVLLVEKGDVLALASAIERLAAEVPLRSELSGNIRKLAAEFDWGAIAGKTVAIYTRALARGVSFIETARHTAKICLESLEFVVLNAIVSRARMGQGVVRKPSGAEKILMIQLNSAGDVLMSTPALRSLSERFQGAAVDCLVQPRTRSILENNPYTGKILTYEDRSWRRVFTSLPSFLKCISVVKFIRKERYDLCVDMGGTFGSAVLSALSGAGTIAGPERQVKCGVFSAKSGDYYNKAVEIKEKHILRQYLEITGAVGCAAPEEKEEIFISDNDAAEGRMFLARHDLKEGGYAVVHPGAKWPPKRWPEGHFAGLVALLSDKKGMRSVLAGSAPERAMLERIKRDSGVENTAIVTDMPLRSLTYVISKARIFIGNDSAPAHIAGAVGAPLVALFGPTDPETSAPPAGKIAVLHDRISCWPCTLYFRRYRCQAGSNACLQGITPDKALEAVESLCARG